MGDMVYNMPVNEVASAGNGVNWLLIGVIAGCFVVGVVIGIILGRKAMKKRDI